jgi:hypothetical protein
MFTTKFTATLAVSILLALSSASARAASTTQPVAGTSLGVLAIASGGPAALTLQAGSTATATSTLIATDTNPSYALTVQDAATGDPGHMTAATLGCSGSEANLVNPLSVEVTSLLGGAHSAGAVSISGTAKTVSSATNQLLAANVLTTNYSQTVASTETLLTGCVYNLTATYTLQ